MSQLSLFGSVCGVIFLAELPDKTAVAALVLATRHRALPVLLGAGLALTVQSAVAVAAGGLFALLPRTAVHVAAGLTFLASAFFMWRQKEDAEEEVRAASGPVGASFLRSAWLSFGVVFVAEWGDLTQIATAALAAQTRAPLTVFAGATLALWLVTSIAVVLGHRAARYLNPRTTQRVAAVLFAGMGLFMLGRAARIF